MIYIIIYLQSVSLNKILNLAVGIKPHNAPVCVRGVKISHWFRSQSYNSWRQKSDKNLRINDLKILNATVKNLVARLTWPPGLLQRCYRWLKIFYNIKVIQRFSRTQHTYLHVSFNSYYKQRFRLVSVLPIQQSHFLWLRNWSSALFR
jgi:hypothetical protein